MGEKEIRLEQRNRWKELVKAKRTAWRSEYEYIFGENIIFRSPSTVTVGDTTE
jgi:hypothetical protein